MSKTTSPTGAKPAHYRLSKATWAIILKEYREGATAAELCAKWRVSHHALRKQITIQGSTKRDWGDAEVMRQAAEREAEMEAARRTGPEALAAALFDGMADPDEEEAGDPGVLARTAIRASGRAMRGRLWAEAKALAGLAESYARLGQRIEGAAVTVDNMDLKLLYEVLTNGPALASRRLGIWGDDGVGDPDRPVKEAYWRWYGKRSQEQNEQDLTVMRRMYSAERRLKELGEPLPFDHPHFGREHE